MKRELKPCVADEYPVDVSYGNLTGEARDDVVVNVLTCGDAVGIGAYVYRPQGDGYVNVFSAEEPPVYAEMDRGDLVVTKQVYDRGDPVSSPSGEVVITYRWISGRFAESTAPTTSTGRWRRGADTGAGRRLRHGSQREPPAGLWTMKG